MVLVMSVVVCGVFSCLVISIYRTRKKQALEEDEKRMIREQKTGEMNYGLDIGKEESPTVTNN